jgi:hypothetical protein
MNCTQARNGVHTMKMPSTVVTVEGKSEADDGHPE